jgi:two-component system LytT family response regulator
MPVRSPTTSVRSAASLTAEAPRDPPATDYRILVSTPTGARILLATEIDWISAADYYAELHVGKRCHLLRESLASLEQRLESLRFVRIHRGAIVNLARVRALRFSGRSGVLTLEDGTRLPVSRRRRGLVKAALKRRDAISR